MKKIMLVVLCLAVVFLAGCETLRKGGIKVSEEELKNVEAIRTIAANYLQIWPMQSGFIRGALGSRMSMLPQEAVNAMDELDQLAENQDQTDKELGYSLGLRVRMLNEVVLEALKLYAPNVFDVVGALAL